MTIRGLASAVEDLFRGEHLGRYSQSRTAGVVAYSTVELDAEQLRRIEQIAPVETLQPQYSLIERDIERAILPYTREHGIAVIAYSPMGSGMLTGAMTRERAATLPENDWRKHDPRFTEPQLSRNLELVQRLDSRRASRDNPGRRRRSLDTAQPRSRRRNRRLPPPRPGRPHPHRCQPLTQ